MVEVRVGFHEWLVWRSNLFGIQLLPINGLKERMRLDLHDSQTDVAAESFCRILKIDHKAKANLTLQLNTAKQSTKLNENHHLKKSTENTICLKTTHSVEINLTP